MASKMEDLPPIRGHGENDDQPLGWFGTIFFFKQLREKISLGVLHCVALIAFSFV